MFVSEIYVPLKYLESAVVLGENMGRIRVCVRKQCVPSRIGAQSAGCPPRQVVRCAGYRPA